MTRRSERASTLALIGASTIVITILLLFALLFAGANFHVDRHRTAIDAAAIAAAEDIGKIVYNSPEVGFVSLVGAPPTSTGTKEVAGGTSTGDGWIDQANSINGLMATARLDYVIASNIGLDNKFNSVPDAFMQQLAVRDQQNILNARDELLQVISNAISGTGQYGYDIAGNKITPYDDALAVYLSNQQANTVYVDLPPTLQLTLGVLSGGLTTAVKAPTSSKNNFTGATATTTNSGYYVSDTDLPYTPSTGSAHDFMLASVGSQPSLVDKGKFSGVTIGTTSGSVTGSAFSFTTATVTYSFAQNLSPAVATPKLLIPACIQVQADQQFSVQGKTFQNHFVACAAPGSSFFAPAQGELTISFPDGPLPEMNCLGDTYAPNFSKNGTPSSVSFAWATGGGNNAAKANCDVYTSLDGDYDGPTGSAPLTASLSSSGPNQAQWGSILPWGATNGSADDYGGTSSSQATLGESSKLAIYNWIRTEGSLADVDSIVNCVSNEFVMPSGWSKFFNSDNKTPANTTAWNSYGPVTSPTSTTALTSIQLGHIPTGMQQIYSFNADGTVSQKAIVMQPAPAEAVDEHQFFCESLRNNGSTGGQGLDSQVNNWTTPSQLQLYIPNSGWPVSWGGSPQNVQFTGTNHVDVYIKNQCIQPGNANANLPGTLASAPTIASTTAASNGGAHAGQPLWQVEAFPSTTASGGSSVPPPSTCDVTTPCSCMTTATCCCLGGSTGTGTGVCTSTCGSFCTCTSSTGTTGGSVNSKNGDPPVLQSQTAFDCAASLYYSSFDPSFSNYETYTAPSSQSPPTRQTYLSAPNNPGISADIMFRRETKITQSPAQSGLLADNRLGYVGLVLP